LWKMLTRFVAGLKPALAAARRTPFWSAC